ncbi:MAG: acyl-CoA thioester hydrolase/BAAT C-terminal domain-containing protein [Pseudomonadota bacterium]
MRFSHLLQTAGLVLTTAACTTTPTLIAEAPERSDQPAKIIVSGIEPGAQVDLIVERPYDWVASETLRSVTAYTANARGRIDTSVQAPEGQGEANPYTVFTSQKRTDQTPWDGATPSDVRVSADLDGDGEVDLNAEMVLPLGHRSTVEMPFDPEFEGAFITRPEGSAGKRLPVIVALGGSGGGDAAVRFAAPRFAALGYAVLALPYHSPAYFGGEAQFPSLPGNFINLPVDYVEAAVAALRKRDDIDPDRIALHGVSKGGELVLLAGSLIPDTSAGGGFCAVAAIVPSDVVWEGWGRGMPPEGAPSFSWRGEPLPFVPYEGMGAAIASLSTANPTPLRVPHDAGRAANPDRVGPASINVRAIDEPVYLLGGDADQTWDSGGMVKVIAERRKGLPTLALTFEKAGHGLSGDPFAPAATASAEARIKAWPALVNFLEENLSKTGCKNPRQ